MRLSSSHVEGFRRHDRVLMVPALPPQPGCKGCKWVPTSEQYLRLVASQVMGSGLASEQCMPEGTLEHHICGGQNYSCSMFLWMVPDLMPMLTAPTEQTGSATPSGHVSLYASNVNAAWHQLGPALDPAASQTSVVVLDLVCWNSWDKRVLVGAGHQGI